MNLRNIVDFQVFFFNFGLFVKIGVKNLLTLYMSEQKQHPVVDGNGLRSKVWCCKEQYCRGTWNVRSMNEGKLEVVKQEMTRVNIDVLGISELKWTGMCGFNSDDHYIYYCGQESIRKNGSHHSQQKNLKCSTWMQSQKWQNNLCSFPRPTIQCHSNPSLCPTTNLKKLMLNRSMKIYKTF